MNRHSLGIQHCVANATDGASNMRGEYNGLAAHLASVSTDHIHVWCFSHILNLVVTDATKVCNSALTLFSVLNGIAVFIRQSYKIKDLWDEMK